jgi:hypothetical protein
VFPGFQATFIIIHHMIKKNNKILKNFRKDEKGDREPPALRA